MSKFKDFVYNLTGKYYIDWKVADQLLTKVNLYIQVVNKDLYTKFQSWYKLKKGKKENILDKDMSKWIIQGSRFFRTISNIVLKDAQQFVNKAQKEYKENKKGDQWKLTMRNSNMTREVLIDALGCDSKASKWFLGLLKFIKSKSKFKGIVKSSEFALEIFDPLCKRLIYNFNQVKKIY